MVSNSLALGQILPAVPSALVTGRFPDAFVYHVTGSSLLSGRYQVRACRFIFHDGIERDLHCHGGYSPIGRGPTPQEAIASAERVAMAQVPIRIRESR